VGIVARYVRRVPGARRAEPKPSSASSVPMVRIGEIRPPSTVKTSTHLGPLALKADRYVPWATTVHRGNPDTVRLCSWSAL